MVQKAQKVLVAVRLPESLVGRMKREAEKRGMTLQGFVQQSLAFYMLHLKLRDKKGT